MKASLARNMPTPLLRGEGEKERESSIASAVSPSHSAYKRRTVTTTTTTELDEMKLSCPPSNLLLREGTNVHPAHGDRGSCERRRSPRKKRIKVGTLTLMRRLREMGRRNRHCPDMHHAFKSVRR